MKLKNYNVKQTIHVSGYDVEVLIRHVYGKPYEIECEEELYECSKTFEVEKRGMDERERRDIHDLRTGRPNQFSLSSILLDLCNDGHLDEGMYIITV